MTAADQPTTEPSITTEAAREALPIGHVVRSASGTIACRATEAFGVVFGDSRTFPWADLALPLTVLYPAPQPAADTERAVQARALREAALEMDNTDDPDAIHVSNGDIDLWLEARADRIERGQEA